MLVISQVALSLVLLVGALLFVGSLRNLSTLDPGFRENGLLITGIDISRINFPPARRAVLYQEVLNRMRAIPGVEGAASTNIVIISGNGWNDGIQILGQNAQERMVPWFNRISPGYFRTIGTALVAGRDFDDRDTTSAPEVAIVNQEFSRKFLGGANPIGISFRVLVGPGELQHVYQVVGLVKNSKYQSLREDFKPQVFVAESQNKTPGLGVHFMLRSTLPLGSLMAAVKKTVLDENSQISLQFQVFTTQVQESLLRERLMATLSGFFGFLAVALATVGLYGVISYMVERRRNEIGIRIALGANRANVLTLVLREAGVLLVAGLGIGIALTLAAGRAAVSLLFGLQPNDPVTIGASVAGLAVVAVAASLWPAMRAARVEPMVALREE
jgi:predicted permease